MLTGFTLLTVGNRTFSSGPMIRLLQINRRDSHCRHARDWPGKAEYFRSQGLKMANIPTRDLTVTKTI
jgi:hypothetical protein